MRIVFSLLLILCNITLSSQQSGYILIENKGQWHRDVLFKTDLKNGHLYTTKSGFIYDFYDEKKLSDFYENHYNNLHLSKNKKLKKHAYRVQFKDSDFSTVIKNQPTKHTFNYFKGNKNSWKSNVKGEVLSKAAIDAKLVIVKTSSGELIALNKDTGLIEWSYRSKLPLLTVRGSSSPVIVDDKIYTSFDNGRLGVFDLNSGFPLWDGAISYVRGVSELENLIDADSPPLVEGGLIYTANYQGNLNIFDIAQKRSVWSYETSSFYSPLIIRGMLIIIEANSAIRSFAMQTMEESWLSEDYLNRDLSNAVSFKGDLAFGDFEGFLHIVDPLNGKTVAREKISRKPIKTVFSRSNKLYAIDEAFNLFLIN